MHVVYNLWCSMLETGLCDRNGLPVLCNSISVTAYICVQWLVSFVTDFEPLDLTFDLCDLSDIGPLM